MLVGRDRETIVEQTRRVLAEGVVERCPALADGHAANSIAAALFAAHAPGAAASV